MKMVNGVQKEEDGSKTPDAGSFLNKSTLWKNFVSRPLIVLWGLGIVFVVVTSLLPQASLTDTNTYTGVDKIARIVAFMGLAFIPTAFFSSIKLGLCIATSMAPLGFILEFAQKYVPHRHFSPEDIIANNIGTIAGIIIAMILRFFFYTGGRHVNR